VGQGRPKAPDLCSETVSSYLLSEIPSARLSWTLSASSLSPAERANFTRHRKEAYEALHPETAHGSPGVSRQVGDTGRRVDTPTFAKDTAARTGKSERTIQRDAERMSDGMRWQECVRQLDAHGLGSRFSWLKGPDGIDCNPAFTINNLTGTAR
jgi:hypothetical protein